MTAFDRCYHALAMLQRKRKRRPRCCKVEISSQHATLSSWKRCNSRSHYFNQLLTCEGVVRLRKLQKSIEKWGFCFPAWIQNRYSNHDGSSHHNNDLELIV